MTEIICLCMMCNVKKVIKHLKYCHSCHDKYFRSPESKEKRRLKKNITGSKRNKRTRPQINSWRKTRRRDKKLEIIERYGSVCGCCDEANQGFLTIDHINNDGYKRRKENKSEGNIVDYLYSREIDLETYQLLCFNCNLGKNGNGGVCPHENVL